MQLGCVVKCGILYVFADCLFVYFNQNCFLNWEINIVLSAETGISLQ